jgi:hypothetical protein
MLCQAHTACMVSLLSQSPGFTVFKTPGFSGKKKLISFAVPSWLVHCSKLQHKEDSRRKEL